LAGADPAKLAEVIAEARATPQLARIMASALVWFADDHADTVADIEERDAMIVELQGEADGRGRTDG
jgi:hypothetical protein